MTDKKELGTRGENAAKEYLIKNGYKIIESNFRKGRLEIDIVAKKNKEYIFVEVKTRLNNLESINENPLTARQAKKLKLAILNYSHEKNISACDIRFDLIFILVDKNNKKAELRHYLNIF